MALKQRAQEILMQMEEGTRDLYARYEDYLKQSDARYDEAKKTLDKSYHETANALATKSQIQLKNTLESMTEKGLGASGQFVQARMEENAGLLSSLAELASKKMTENAQLETQKAQAATSIEKERESKIEQYRETLSKQYDDLLRSEASAAAKTASAKTEESKTKSSEITFKESPAALLNSIVAANSVYNKKYKTTRINVKAVREAVNTLLKDQKISAAYRYELYTKAKALGYGS